MVLSLLSEQYEWINIHWPSKDGRFRKIAQSIFNLWEMNVVNQFFV